MQTLNFTLKQLREQRFLSFLLPLFAIFLGLGSTQSVLAQSSIASASITLNVKGTAATYDAKPSSAGTSNFANRDFGSFDISTDVFSVTNGVLTINEDPSENYDQAVLRVRVAPGTLASTISVPFIDIPLTNAGLSGGVRTFTPTTAGYDILSAVTSPASGGSYRFDINFVATDNTNVTTLSTGLRKSVFTATGTRPVATNLNSTTVIVNPNNVANGNTTYNASASGPPKFDGRNLGTFDINTGQLILNGGTATTFESGGDAVLNVIMNYRVYKNGSAPGTFSSLSLPQITSGGGTRQFSLTNAQKNLIANLANAGTGNFFVQVFYTSDVRKANGTFITLVDNNGGANYTANFDTNGTPIQTDTWTGTVDDNWFNPGNWDLNRIPDATTNVVIPNFTTGNPTPYPNIYSDQSFLNTPNPNTGNPRTTVNNVGSGPALSRNLTLLGASSTIDRSILRLQSNSTIKIYGDFSNQFLSYITRDNSNTWFASATPQQIAQANYATLTVSGGGTKAVTGVAFVGESFVFDSSNGNTIVTTDSNNPGGSYIQLADRLAVNANNGAQLVGETNTSYILGLIVTRRASVLANEGSPRTLGGIGFTFEFTGASDPGDVDVTRSTVQNYFLSSTRLSVRRVFGVRPSNLGRAGFALRANVTFTVLPNETMNLNPNNGSIPEQNLVLFLSKNNGGTFRNLNRDGAVVNYTVTRSQVDDFATFTLGDQGNPLPVRLTAFDTKRVGSDALVTWQTASEQNSKGYEVQVSTNGKEYRTLTFVASASPNSTGRTDYRYVDKEANKAGQRYYRLHQIDTDGKDAYFGPNIVSFEGSVAASSLVAYPNPFKGGEEMHIALQSAATGKAQVRIADMTGRTLRQESVEVAIGVSDFALRNFSELKSGMYLVQVTLPSGETKSTKVVKQ